MAQFITYFILGGIIFLISFILIFWLTKKSLKLYRKKIFPEVATSFKCFDGHIVRSKGELVIDNHLYRLGLEHEYENTIKVKGNPIKYDWYLPKLDTYIEYWGFFGKTYMKRKEEKLNLYNKGKLKLISIEDIMLKDLYTNLENEINKYVKLDKISKRPKHCPNCGIKLDDRILSE